MKSSYKIPVPLPFELIRRICNVNPLIINYHVVSDHKLSHVINLYNYRNTKIFSEDIDFIRKHYYPITLLEFLNSIKNKISLPDNSVLLTFDDGFQEIFTTVAPILVDKKMPATFFLTEKFIDNRELGYDNKKSLIIEKLYEKGNEQIIHKIKDLPEFNKIPDNDITYSILHIPYKKRQLVDKIGEILNIGFSDFLESNKPYLTSTQIHQLIDEGFTFGGHSIDHPRFSELTLEEQIHQVISSVLFLSDNFSLGYKVFAFPYSDGGVSLDLFRKISDHTDVTFGTHGLLHDIAENNYQRISVEKFDQSALKTIKFHYSRKILYKIFNKDVIKRK